jgi:hypothetical protein
MLRSSNIILSNQLEPEVIIEGGITARDFSLHCQVHESCDVQPVIAQWVVGQRWHNKEQKGAEGHLMQEAFVRHT